MILLLKISVATFYKKDDVHKAFMNWSLYTGSVQLFVATHYLFNTFIIY